MKNALAVMEPQDPNDDLKQKTDKKILKRAEKMVRKLDNVVNDLNLLVLDSYDLVGSMTDIAEKDVDRFLELKEVILSTNTILFQLTNRMARKYVGKAIEPIGNSKRKALKV